MSLIQAQSLYYASIYRMLTSFQTKLNYKKIADYYGNGATYDAIEGRFRIVRKDAGQLRNELESGERPPAPPRGNQGSNHSTPRKSRAGRANNSFQSNDCTLAAPSLAPLTC